jgi:hypothetical protein
VVMVTGALVGPTETAMTVMVSLALRVPRCVAWWELGVNPCALLECLRWMLSHGSTLSLLVPKKQTCPLRTLCTTECKNELRMSE